MLLYIGAMNSSDIQSLSCKSIQRVSGLAAGLWEKRCRPSPGECNASLFALFVEWGIRASLTWVSATLRRLAQSLVLAESLPASIFLTQPCLWLNFDLFILPSCLILSNVDLGTAMQKRNMPRP